MYNPPPWRITPFLAANEKKKFFCNLPFLPSYIGKAFCALKCIIKILVYNPPALSAKLAIYNRQIFGINKNAKKLAIFLQKIREINQFGGLNRNWRFSMKPPILFGDFAPKNWHNLAVNLKLAVFNGTANIIWRFCAKGFSQFWRFNWCFSAKPAIFGDFVPKNWNKELKFPDTSRSIILPLLHRQKCFGKCSFCTQSFLRRLQLVRHVNGCHNLNSTVFACGQENCHLRRFRTVGAAPQKNSIKMKQIVSAKKPISQEH